MGVPVDVNEQALGRSNGSADGNPRTVDRSLAFQFEWSKEPTNSHHYTFSLQSKIMEHKTTRRLLCPPAGLSIRALLCLSVRSRAGRGVAIATSPDGSARPMPRRLRQAVRRR